MSKTASIITIWIAFIMVIGGGLLRTFVDRRRFYRRGISGLQEYDSYFHAKLGEMIDSFLYGLGGFISIAGFVLCAVGIYMVSQLK